jgi:hypothetical protein
VAPPSSWPVSARLLEPASGGHAWRPGGAVEAVSDRRTVAVLCKQDGPDAGVSLVTSCHKAAVGGDSGARHRRCLAPALLQSLAVDALLAFAAALVTLRLSGDLVRRYRARRAPELAVWSAALAAYAAAAGALAWGAAAGWSDAVFRIYYLGGGLLTAALLGTGSLLLAGRRGALPAGLVYAGIAVGMALAVPLEDVSGTAVPEAQKVLELWPARVLAIAGNTLGTLAVLVVAVTTFRARPLGNVLILAGVAVAALGSGLGGLGVGALAPILVIAAVLLYAGFVVPRRPR